MRKRILLILMMVFVIAALSNTAFAITMPKTTEAVCPTCTKNGGGTWPTDKFTTTWTLQSVDWTSTQGYHQGVYKCNGCGDTVRKFLGQHSYSDYWPNGEPIAGYTEDAGATIAVMSRKSCKSPRVSTALPINLQTSLPSLLIARNLRHIMYSAMIAMRSA